MADASFDVVVVGGGHQGLIAANYMVRNGYTVGLFEQRDVSWVAGAALRRGRYLVSAATPVPT